MFDWLRFWGWKEPPVPVTKPSDTEVPEHLAGAEPLVVRGRAWADTSEPLEPKKAIPMTPGLSGLIAKLTHRDASTREAAVLELGTTGAAREAVTPLVRAAVDVERGVRVAAVAVLDRGEPKWPELLEADAIKLLVSALDSRFAEVWQQAVVLLGRVGGAAVPALCNELPYARDAHQLTILRALARIGPPAAPAVPELTHTLASEFDHVRREAAGALAAIGLAAEPATAALTAALADRNSDVRLACARSLARIGSPAGAAVPALLQLAADHVPAVRTAAGEALAQVGPGAVPALAEAVAERDAARLRAALHRHSELSDWWSRPWPPGVSREPLKVLRNVDWFFQYSEDELARVELVHAAALKALGRIGPEAAVAVPAVTAALADASRDVRASAAEALGRIGSAARTAGPALAGALVDASESVRKNASAALPQVDPDWATAPEAAQLLASWGAALCSVGAKAQSAGEALKLAGASAVPALLTALEATDRVAREQAATLLGQLGPAAREAVPALRRALADSHGWVRQAASQALKQIAPEEPLTAGGP